MSGRLLETDERQRFVRYCREQAQDCDTMAKQLDAMPHLEAVARHNRTRAMAYAIVANDLASVEDVTIGAVTPSS
jgi:hypothetical protein